MTARVCRVILRQTAFCSFRDEFRLAYVVAVGRKLLIIIAPPHSASSRYSLSCGKRSNATGTCFQSQIPVTSSDKKAFVAAIEHQHGRRLRRFLAARLRNAAADLPDLVQEVFLRLLRISDHETIRSSEAYLFTIASHVLHQHTLRRSALPEAVEITDLLTEVQSTHDDPASHLEIQERLRNLQRVLGDLTPKAQAVLLLHRRDGYSLEEIGNRLGISRAMAAKYLSKALLHCRKHLARGE